MTDLLLLLIFNVLLIVGVFTLFSEGMLMDVPGQYIRAISKDLAKPLIDCPPCMSSVWGTAVFWWWNPLDWNHACIWPFYVLACCGIAKLVASKLLTD